MPVRRDELGIVELRIQGPTILSVVISYSRNISERQLSVANDKLTPHCLGTMDCEVARRDIRVMRETYRRDATSTIGPTEAPRHRTRQIAEQVG
jgi:hypothetical protein